MYLYLSMGQLAATVVDVDVQKSGEPKIKFNKSKHALSYSKSYTTRIYSKHAMLENLAIF